MKITIPKIPALIFYGLIFSFYTSYSQSKVLNKETFLEAESYFVHEEFSDALPLYMQLKEKYPANYNLDYRIGRCYLYLPYEKTKSVKYLETAVKHITTEYKEGKFTENGAPKDALFYLGDAYRINDQLDKAITTYKSFKNEVNNSNYDMELINDQINCCIRAIEAKKRPVDVDIVNLGSPVNTRYSESNPVISANDNMLVYSVKLPFYQGVLYSKKVAGKWTEPINMIPELGVDDDCYPTCISSDGTELYIYRSNDYRGDLYVTNFVNNKWTKLRKLNSNINTKYWESHASLSGDGKTLYFTSNREGGFGGLDIYKSVRTGGDNWGPAVNLGNIINTKYNEETPFIMPDGKKLFFSSYGHGSIGGYDIYYSVLSSNGTWTKPVNMGYPINTTDDDLFYCPINDGAIAYTAGYDPSGFGRSDILCLHVYTYDNPRKYSISGMARIQNTNSVSPVFYLSLYDKIKKDTVLKKKFDSDKINFEAVPGNYDVVIRSSSGEIQTQPLSIAYGSKDLKRLLNYNLIPYVNNFDKKTESNNINPISQQQKTDKISARNTESVNVSTLAATDQNKQNSSDTTTISNNDSDTSKRIVSGIEEKSGIPDNVTNVPIEKSGLKGENNFIVRTFQWLKMHKSMSAGIILIPLIFIIWFLLKKRKKEEN